MTPSEHTTPLPTIIDAEEWEMQRSESAQMLDRHYSNELSHHTAQPPSAGRSIPARTMSTFNLASRLARISHKALAVLNSPRPSPQDTIQLLEAKSSLDGLVDQFTDFSSSDPSALLHTAQSKIDLFLRLGTIRVLLEQALTPATVLSTCASVERILHVKRQHFSWYRTPVPTLTVCMAFASAGLPDVGQMRICQDGRNQLRKIFPDLLDQLESMTVLSGLSHSEPATAMRDPSGTQISSAHLDARSVIGNGGSDHALGSLLVAAASVFEDGSPRPAANLQSLHTSDLQSFATATRRPIPHQAMQSIADMLAQTDGLADVDEFGTSKMFDSATW